MSRSWAKGSTTAWRRVRAQVLHRDRYECQIRIEGKCTGHATCVHHIKGRAITGDDPEWLTASCQPCNLHIGDPTKQTDPPAEPRIRW